MADSKSDYDRSVNTFSKEGRLHQVEYAMEAIKLGTTALGLRLSAGTILAAEKRVRSALLIPASLDKIMQIDTHIGAAVAGIVSDGKTLVEQARRETNDHRLMYGEPMSIETCAQTICDISLNFGEGKKKSMSRPYGVALLIAGVDRELDPATKQVRYVPQLYHTDPTGTYQSVEYKAIGGAAEPASAKLNEEYFKAMTLEEGEDLCVQTLKQVMEDKVTENNIEIAIVSAETGRFTTYPVERVKAIILRTADKDDEEH